MISGISVVIPNYNGVALFPVTLPTVEEALKVTQKPFEIIVVDDCSTDDSVTYLQETYPSVIIIHNIFNSGFSITANKGISAANYDKVLLLNSDVKLTPDYLTGQFKYFDRADTFGVMGRIIGWEDDQIQDGAKYPSFQGGKIKTSKNYLLKDEQAMAGGLYSMYLSGANAFIDKEKILAIGGFNELFSPFYVEDFELSLRAWRLGFKCYYNDESICKHKTSTTIKSSSRKKFVEIIYNRNKFFLHAIHLSGNIKLLWYVQLFAEAFLKLLTGKWNYLQSLKLFFNASVKVKQSRMDFENLAIKNHHNKSVKEVANFILNEIEAKEKIIF